jgi:2-oxo-3-hexenedioate decarboxylase
MQADMDSATHRSLARTLDAALLEGREIPRLTEQHPDLKLPDAYAVQDEGIRMRHGRGERYRGMKMGLTSRAKREQMGLHRPIYGVLTHEMEVPEGGAFRLGGQRLPTIHPKIEPEIAFLIEREIRGRISLDEAPDAVGGVCAAMEILDSRFTGFKYFSLEDVVADNCSSAWFTLGRRMAAPRQLDLANLRMRLEVTGAAPQEALSSEISGHPLQSLVQLCDILAERGLPLPAGSIVLAGAATQAVKLEPGQTARLAVDGLGELRLRIEA